MRHNLCATSLTLWPENGSWSILIVLRFRLWPVSLWRSPSRRDFDPFSHCCVQSGEFLRKATRGVVSIRSPSAPFLLEEWWDRDLICDGKWRLGWVWPLLVSLVCPSLIWVLEISWWVTGRRAFPVLQVFTTWFSRVKAQYRTTRTTGR